MPLRWIQLQWGVLCGSQCVRARWFPYNSCRWETERVIVFRFKGLEGKMERQIVERLHSASTAHIVSLWSQLGSDWWCNYNMDMRYLHKAATIIHSQVVLFTNWPPRDIIKHVVGKRMLQNVLISNETGLWRDHVRVKRVETWLVPEVCGTLFGISVITDILLRHWCQNITGCCTSLMCVFLCVLSCHVF